MAASTDRARDVALRQAFGAGFEVTRDDSALVADAQAGTIRLPPHPPFTFERGVDWQSDPFTQRNWRAQLHMLRWLDPLRRQARAGRKADFRTWEAVVHDWARANSDPGEATEWAWTDMVDAIRTEVVLYGLPYAADPATLLELLALHRDWLLDPSNLGHSNHALHQHSALFQVSRALGDKAAVRESIARLRDHFRSSYDEQGLNSEGAPGYWAFNLTWGREVLQRLEREGQDADFIADVMRRTAHSVAHATRPDGRLEALGDTVPAPPRPGLDDVLEYVRSAGSRGTPPATTSVVYAGGYAFGRSGWGETRRRMDEESFYSLVFGPSTKVHGHVDAGSFTFFVGGTPLVVDAGKYSYTTTPERAYVMSRAAHNVVRVLGAEYDSSVAVRLLRHESCDAYDYLRLEDTGYEGTVLVRDFLYLRSADALLIIDTVRAEREVEAELRILVDPQHGVEQHPGYLVVGEAGISFGGTLPEIGVTRASSAGPEGWVSERWHEMSPSHLVTARRRGSQFRFVTAVTGSRPAAALRSVELADGGRAWRVLSAAGTFDVAMDGGRVRVERPGGVGGGAASWRGAPARPGPEVPATIIEREAVVARARRLLVDASPGVAEGFEPDALRGLGDLVGAGDDYGGLVTARDLRGAGLTGTGLAEDDLGGAIRGAYPYRSGKGGSERGVVVHDGRVDRGLVGDRAATHVVEVGALALPIRVDPRGSRTMVVGFSGALDRSGESLPRFERARSLGRFGRTVAVASDATLDLRPDLGLGWYLGTLSRDLHADIADAVGSIAAALGASKVLLVGSSGGGFAALQVGSLLPDSHVVAINPQTDVRRYHARYAERALSVISGSPDGSALQEERISAVERLRGGRHARRITLVANRGDEYHLQHHVRPFLAAAACSGAEVVLAEVDSGPGHVSPDNQDFARIVLAALEVLEA